MANVFFIQCTARSGSTWLHTLLDSHPEIICEGEVLHPAISVGLYSEFLAKEVCKNPSLVDPFQHGLIFERYMREKAEAATSSTYGFNLKLEQLFYHPTLWSVVYKPTHKFIVLHRLNLLKQVISEALMYERIRRDPNDLVHQIDAKPLTTITVQPQAIIGAMRNKKRLNDDYRQMIRDAGCDHVVVSYEELTGVHGNEYVAGLQDYLGVSRSVVKTDLAKQNPYPLWEMVSNWQELYEAVRLSEFAYTPHLPA